MRSVERWQLVLDRNPLADGQFVYGVRSTGIYCRPTCPSRRPRADQVEFFETPNDAERAGYRSCLRCKPEARRPRAQTVISACAYLKANVDRRVTLKEIARHVGLSPFHLQRIFKEQTGISPRQYQASLRTDAVRTSLRTGSSVTESVYQAGFSSSSRFYESAGQNLGMSPSTWRKGGQGVSVLFCIFPSPLGKILLAATGKGVCFLAIGDRESELESQLHAELPAAAIQRDDQALLAYKDGVFDYLSGSTPHPDLPLDVRATAFQARVWNVLRTIAPGQTRTYSNIARELGDLNLTRAVARACATNPVPVVIPCHRVVRQTGDLAGYRWGLERKQKLLALEHDVK